MGSTDGSPSLGAILATFAVFVGLGFPLVYVIWETINQALTGNMGAVRLELFLPALVLLGILLIGLGRVLRRWSAGP